MNTLCVWYRVSQGFSLSRLAGSLESCLEHQPSLNGSLGGIPYLLRHHQPTGRRNNLLQRVQTRIIPMDNAKFGFSSFAEQWNGRLAMMGFVIGLGTELLTGQGILSQVGLG